jgi:phage shock protein A
MAVITRISRLFKADFHAVLDQIEEPELMLRQAIREMQDDLAEREQRIRVATNERTELRARQDELALTLNDIEDQLDLCFTSQKPELARNLVRRKLETQRHTRYLANRESTIEKYLGEQRVMLDEHRMTLDGLKQKAEIFTRRSREAASSGEAAESLGRDLTVSDDEVEVAFLREQKKRRTV